MDPGLTIVLLGDTGVGKSASGNTTLGRRAFESRQSISPVTKLISEETAEVFGKQISVVDTPGIFVAKQELQTYCQNLLQSPRQCLFLVVISVGRFTQEQIKVLQTASNILGSQTPNFDLLFTRGDSLEDMSLEDFICEKRAQLDYALTERCHLFNNKDGGPEQVRELLMKSGLLRTQQQPESGAEEIKVRRIVLLGRPGSGKSSSGNTILRSDHFEPVGGFSSVSTETVSGSTTVEGHQVTVVDTPGLSDEVLTPRQLFEEIMKSITEASPGPHAFIIVVRIGHMSTEDIKLFELLSKLFMSEALKYSMVLFTHGDQLGGQSIEQKIQSNSTVSDLVSMCGGRYCVFENKRKSNRGQVRELLGKIDEMVRANGGQHFTNDMFRMVHTRLVIIYRLWEFVKTHKKMFLFLGSLALAAVLSMNQQKTHQNV